jgi:hypothetical protein
MCGPAPLLVCQPVRVRISPESIYVTFLYAIDIESQFPIWYQLDSLPPTKQPPVPRSGSNLLPHAAPGTLIPHSRGAASLPLNVGVPLPPLARPRRGHVGPELLSSLALTVVGLAPLPNDDNGATMGVTLRAPSFRQVALTGRRRREQACGRGPARYRRRPARSASSLPMVVQQPHARHSVAGASTGSAPASPGPSRPTKGFPTADALLAHGSGLGAVGNAPTGPTML